ncbi:MAG: hypothetical protein IJS53_02410, partial [Clostridia bacterium]|nr:hypothetical protein [Clostridia bacterium]
MKHRILLALAIVAVLLAAALLLRPMYRVKREGTEYFGQVTSETQAMLDRYEHFCFDASFAKEGLAEYRYAFCRETMVQPTTYIYMRTKSLSGDAWRELAAQIDASLLRLGERDGVTYYCAKDTLESLRFFYDETAYDGARCFYNIAVLDAETRTIDLWICFNDDGGGDKDAQFER